MPFTEEEVANIINQYEQTIKNSESSIEFAAQQITILEAEKEKLQKPAKVLDQSLYKRVKDVKTPMDALASFYSDRVSADNRSDLFWRVVGISGTPQATPTSYKYILRCEELSKYYDIVSNEEETGISDNDNSEVENYDTSTVMVYDPNLSYPFIQYINTTSTEYDDTKLDPQTSDPPTFESLGIASVRNIDGLKLYTEPYTEDIFDTIRAQSYGVVRDGDPANVITLLTPVSVNTNGTSEADANPFKETSVGDLVTADDENVIPGGSTNIIAFSNEEPFFIINNFDYTPYAEILGVGVTLGQAYQIKVQDAPAVGFSTQPLASTGNYPLYTISQDPSTISEYNFAENFEESPYNPQEIKIITGPVKDVDGNGIKIEKSAEGYNKKFATWNKDLEGFPDPSDIEVTVREPLVSNGRKLYRYGYTNKPQVDLGSGFVDAVVGTMVTFTSTIQPTTAAIGTMATYVATAGSFDSSQEATLTTAEQEAVDAWRNSNLVNDRIALSNLLKDRMNEINIQVWGFRLQIGQAQKLIEEARLNLAELDGTNPFKLLNDAEKEL